MEILRFDLLIITTLLLAFGLILLATQADETMDFGVRSSQITTNRMRSADWSPPTLLRNGESLQRFL